MSCQIRRRRSVDAIVTGLTTALFVVAALISTLVGATPAAAAVDPSPPVSPTKLIFIHHSTGELWLADDHGGLGLELRRNDYFVSDTNYGWGRSLPPSRGEDIGTTTDIGDWWTWFRGPASDQYMTALYAESDRHSNGYSRLATDPGGPNEIVMFKSCFPNSVLRDDGSPVPPIADNPLKGKAWGGGPGWEVYTVANAKGIYLDLLKYFGAHPEKLFVAVVAPPIIAGDTPDGRKLANWLVHHWLQDAGYTTGNVMVFDLYNVLTSKPAGAASDVGLASGNHHRLWNGAVQHKADDGRDRLAYPTSADDSHPNAAGLKKATAEFVPLLNAAYNAWRENGGSGDTVGPRTFAPRAATVRKGARATLHYRVTDNISKRATVTIRIRNRAGVLKKTLRLGLRGTGPIRQVRFICRLPRGVYRFTVQARDLSGNAARKPLGSNRLTVR